jgi:integrase
MAKALRSSGSSTSQILVDRKIVTATGGLNGYTVRCLTELCSKENASTIAEYILAMRTEINIKDSSRVSTIKSLTWLVEHLDNKSLKKMTRQDVLSYLDSLRKPESADPQHGWIGNYNNRYAVFAKFFKWLYAPSKPPEQRKTPAVMKNIKKLKRKEESIYKPTDLWLPEDHALFLKYCPSRRDRCYHTVAIDTSARPHELLGLKIKDIIFKQANNIQYAEVRVSGKTGSRIIPLINSIPHVKDWLEEHPQRGNPDAPLFISVRKGSGKPLGPGSLGHIYTWMYKREYFPRLLKMSTVPSEDKQRLEELLKKPWNLYIFRHSALTEKSTILKEHVLRQHAGWSRSSKMHLRYLHYFGNESTDSLLEAYGVVKKENHFTDVMKSRTCPDCKEPNRHDALFCKKCHLTLTHEAYNSAVEGEKKLVEDLVEKKIHEIIARVDLSKLQNPKS